MATAPRKSAAQTAAGQAFAAAGRASQARSRAAYMKAHHGRKPPVSKARHQAAQRWAAAGRAAQAAKRAGKQPAPSAKRAAVMPEELLLAYPGADWPTGCNETAPTCASVAVASHLLASTGYVLTDEDILKLHALAGGDGGASIKDTLEAVSEHWLSFAGRRVRLLSFFQADESFLLSGMVVGVRLPHAGHAVLSAPGGMISWGQFLPWEGEPEEAWCLEWGI